MAFKPLFHHLSLSSGVLSSHFDTLDSGTGSNAWIGAPAIATTPPVYESTISEEMEIEWECPQTL
jgi:hypothetical protein